MFRLAAGVVLPPARDAGLLVGHPPLWQLIASDLEEQLCLAKAAECPPHLWIACADGAAPPEAIRQELARALAIGAAAIQPRSEPQDLAYWLRSSQLLVLLSLDPPSAEASSLRLRNERLHQALPQQATVCRSLRCAGPREAGGEVAVDPNGALERFSGDQRLDPERPLHLWPCIAPYNEQLRQHGQRRRSRQESVALLSDRGWRIDAAVHWALQNSQDWRQRSDRDLRLRALALAVLLLLIPIALPGLPDRLFPGLLLLLAGGLYLSRQPRRQRAQQWWCLAQLLWVQDLWHRFGLEEPLGEGLRHDQPLDSERDHGQLLHLLRAHHMGLRLEEAPPPWDRTDLQDAVVGLERHQRLIEKARRRRDERRRQAVIAAPGLLLLAIAIVIRPEVFGLELGLLEAGVVALALWRDRPLPLVSPQRLRRHHERLGRELLELRQALHASPLQEHNLRGHVRGVVQRIGAEILDLARDALDAASWRWPLQP